MLVYSRKIIRISYLLSFLELLDILNLCEPSKCSCDIHIKNDHFGYLEFFFSEF